MAVYAIVLTVLLDLTSISNFIFAALALIFCLIFRQVRKRLKYSPMQVYGTNIADSLPK